MTIAYIPPNHPTAAQLPSTSDTKPTTVDNRQMCAASFVRAVEDSTIYTATRCSPSMGGCCRKTNLTTGDSPATLRAYVATAPYTEKILVRVGASTDGASNAVVVGGETFTLPINESVSDFSQHTRIVKPVTVGSGDKTDLGLNLFSIIVGINNSSVRIWYVTFEPVPTAPGNITVS